MKKFIIDFVKKYKWWIVITLFFVVLRIVVWVTFWNASQNFGGFMHFVGHAQPANSVLMNLYHDYCDWHPPLYYVFTSFLQSLSGGIGLILFAQIIIAYIAMIYSYRVVRLFFSEKLALISVFLIAINPVAAWYNILLFSMNLLALFLIIGIFYFFKFFKENKLKYFYFSSFFFALSALTRPNFFLLTIVLSIILIFVPFLIKNLKDNVLFSNKKNFIAIILTFNFIFLIVLSPWLIRNRIVYERFMLANIMSTNIYFYNVPMSIAFAEKISYSDARAGLAKLAEEKLGENVGDQGDCNKFALDEFNNQLKFYKDYSKEYILSNPVTYFTMHFVKTTPFFFQSGIETVWTFYTNNNDKPDITGALLRGDFATVINFVKSVNMKYFFYFLGLAFWGLCSLSLFISLIYSWFRAREKFVFFFFSFWIILYNALVVSPFVEIRYKLPISIMFFIPLVYLINELFLLIKYRKINNKN